MMLAVAGVLLAANPISVAATDFGVVGDVKPETATFLSESFAQKLSESPRLKVTTAKNLAALVGLERQRQLLGCTTDSSSCLAELAGAYGAEAVVIGEVAKLEKSTRINLRIVGVDGSMLYSTALRGDTVDDLVDALARIAPQAVEAVSKALSKPADGAHEVSTGSRSASLGPWIVTGVGAATAIVGVVLLIVSSSQLGMLGHDSISFTPTQASMTASSAAQTGTIGVGLLVGGLVVLAAGIVWKMLSGEAQ